MKSIFRDDYPVKVQITDKKRAVLLQVCPYLNLNRIKLMSTQMVRRHDL